MSSEVLKVCVVGPKQHGKTLLCRLLADQPLPSEEYSPTAGVRIQEFTKRLGAANIQVQLWDCSGSAKYQPYWKAIGRDLDGLLLVYDANDPTQHTLLERFYTSFGQANNLTKRQCMTLGLTINGYTSSTDGLQGKLQSLTNCTLNIRTDDPHAAAQEAHENLALLLQGMTAARQ